MRLRAMIGNEEQRLRLQEYDTLGLLKEPERQQPWLKP